MAALAGDKRLRASLESSDAIPNANLARRVLCEWRSIVEEERFLEMVSDVVKQRVWERGARGLVKVES